MSVYIGSKKPYLIVTDPDLGFTGFHVLPGIKHADEIMALEWLFERYRLFDLFVPILIDEYVDKAPGGAKSMESLIEKGYLEKTGINIMATEFLVNCGLALYPRRSAPAGAELAKREREHIVILVKKLIENDPECLVTSFITTRMYGAHGTCRGDEVLTEKLSAFGRWLDRGYYVVPISEIDRNKPVEKQLPGKIEWMYPKKKAS